MNVSALLPRKSILLVHLFLLAVTAGCGSGSSGGGGSGSGSVNTPPPVVTLQSVAVKPANPTIPASLTTQFTAFGTYSDGTTQDITSSVNWTSATTSVATVAAGGLTSGVAAGSSLITATSGSISGNTTLTTTSATLLSISVTTANPSVPAGSIIQFTATGTYSDGTEQDITSSVTWTSATPSVATFGAVLIGGIVRVLPTGVALGVLPIGAPKGTKLTSLITAALGGINGSTTFEVSDALLWSIVVAPTNPSVAVRSTRQFTATGTYSDGTSHDVTSSVTWASATTSVATVVPGGLASGVAAGSAVITASSGGVSKSTTLTVTEATLLHIAVSPADSSVPVGLTKQFTATGTYADGTSQDITSSVTWSSATTSVATVVTSGLASGVAAGSAVITASSGAVSGSTTLTVAILQSIAVTPATPTVHVGWTQQFVATGTYSDGTSHDITSSVTWASATISPVTWPETSVVTVAAGGLASGVALGSADITATSGGISGSKLLTVTPTPQYIAVSPANPTVQAGGTKLFTATLTLANGTSQDITSLASWTSATTSVATVGISTGVASGVAAGSTVITASWVDPTASVPVTISGSTSLTVTAAPILQSIAVTPANPSVQAGLTKQLMATGTYSDGTSHDITSSVTWSSATISPVTLPVTSVATVAAGGLASGVAAGSAVIKATSGSISGSTTQTVW